MGVSMAVGATTDEDSWSGQDGCSRLSTNTERRSPEDWLRIRCNTARGAVYIYLDRPVPGCKEEGEKKAWSGYED